MYRGRGVPAPAGRAQKRKRQRPKSLALSSLIISQRRWILRLRRSGGQLSRLASGVASSGTAFGGVPACAERSLRQLFRWPAFHDLRPGAASSGPSGLHASQLALGLLVPGFLWPTSPALIGCCVLRRFAFDRLPAFVFRISPAVSEADLSTCVDYRVPWRYQSFTSD